MKKTFYLILVVLSALSLICCSQQQTVKEIAFDVLCGSSTSATVTISADTNADAYVFVGGAYVSVTANPYNGNYGTLEVVRNNSDWTVSYTGLLLEGQETITVVIGVSSGATLSKQNGTINVKCTVTAQPKKDQLNVTTSCETLVIGSPAADSPYQKAVNKRLNKKVSAYNTETTKAIVIYPDALGTLTEEQKANIVDCWKKGGDVAFVSIESETIMAKLINNVLPKLREKTYEIEVEKFNTEGITEEDWLKYRGEHLWRIGYSVEELIENLDFITVGFHIGNRYSYQGLSEDMIGLTDYQAGLMADGLASWMNTTTAGDTKDAGLLSDLSDAEIFTRNYTAYRRSVNYSYDVSFANVIQETFTVYTAHDEDKNRDWYEVDQKMTFRNSLTDPVPCPDDNTYFWVGKNSDGDKAWVVCPLAFWENTVSLSLTNGNVVIYESHPDTANQKKESNYKTPQGKTTKIACSQGTPGFAGIMAISSFARTFATAAARISDFQVQTGTSQIISDLSVTKTTNGNAASFRYSYYGCYVYTNSKVYCAWYAAPLAYTDCDEQNSILYYVDNPSGAPTIKSTIDYGYNFMWVKPNSTKEKFANKDFSLNNSFTLRIPKRYTSDWTIQCVGYGDVAGNQSKMAEFDKMLNDYIIGGADNRTNLIGGIDANDTTDANILLEQFMSEFKSYNSFFAGYGFTGNYTFKFQSTNGKYLQKSYTVTK